MRFILRALRAISSIRKKLSKEGNGLETVKSVRDARVAGHDQTKSPSIAGKKLKSEPGALLQEEEIYLNILEQVS